jgi:hypothetical protein
MRIQLGGVAPTFEVTRSTNASSEEEQMGLLRAAQTFAEDLRNATERRYDAEPLTLNGQLERTPVALPTFYVFVHDWQERLRRPTISADTA